MGEAFRELLQRAAGGDAEAVERLLAEHLSGLRGYLRLRAGPLIRDREEVSDLVQAVCFEVLKKLDRFEHGGEEAFRHWLYTTALRQVRNRAKYWGREKRSAVRELRLADRPHAAAQETRAESLLDLYRTFTTPSRKLMSSEAVRRIEEAFDRLADDHKEVISLARLVGLPHKEIAARMGRSEEAVRALLHRALAALEEQLERAPSGR